MRHLALFLLAAAALALPASASASEIRAHGLLDLALPSGADASTGASAYRLAWGWRCCWPPWPPRPRPPRRRRFCPPWPPAPPELTGVVDELVPGRVSPICGAGLVSPTRGLDDDDVDVGLFVSSLTTGTP